MKTLAIATCVVLLFATLVFGVDQQEVEKFHRNWEQCAQELGVSAEPPTGNLVKCSMLKDGTLYDAQSGIKPERIISMGALLVADSSNVDKVGSMLRKCLNDVTQAGGTNDEMFTKAAECGAQVMPFFA